MRDSAVTRRDSRFPEVGYARSNPASEGATERLEDHVLNSVCSGEIGTYRVGPVVGLIETATG